MPNPKRILSNQFPGSSRGPVLVKILWDNNCDTNIEKIIYEGNRCVKFVGLQTLMITPHEVYGGDFFDSGDGIYDLGHSEWFQSMSDQHLKKCKHYRLFFYDEIIDVICEDIVIEQISIQNKS